MTNRWLMLSVLLLGTSCTPVLVDMDLDADEDGLLDSEEEQIGTDPNNPDSDEDGHLDGDEANVGFDPLDGEDHPYLGNYPILRCDPEAVGTGYGVGEVSPDFELEDQHGEMVKLSDFCGNVVLLVAAADW